MENRYEAHVFTKANLESSAMQSSHKTISMVNDRVALIARHLCSFGTMLLENDYNFFIRTM
uniref:Uncharacterized protein n=1 Tax=Salix viminalis TaxID=40686 RepID=A0A6N2KW51_SALVM